MQYSEECDSLTRFEASEVTCRAAERKVAAACARVAVLRFVDKARGKLEKKERECPEAVRRNETKAQPL